MTAKGQRQQCRQCRIALQEGDVGADNSIAETSLQLAQFCRGSVRSAGGRRLVTGQLRPRNREVAGQWLADNHARSAKLPVPGENRDQLSTRSTRIGSRKPAEGAREPASKGH